MEHELILQPGEVTASLAGKSVGWQEKGAGGGVVGSAAAPAPTDALLPRWVLAALWDPVLLHHRAASTGPG